MPPIGQAKRARWMRVTCVEARTCADRSRSRRGTGTWTLGIALSACAAGAPHDARTGDRTLGMPRLEVVGERTATLEPNAPPATHTSAEFKVRYVNPDGSPLANEPIEFSLVGTSAGGTTLSAPQQTTASDGSASVLVTAGPEAGPFEFEVQATPPVGDSVRFRVLITNEAVGSLVVTVQRGDDHAIDRLSVHVLGDTDCLALDPASLPEGLIPPERVAPSADPIALIGIPTGPDRVVAVVGTANEEVVAFGCTENIAIQRREESAVSVLVDAFEPALTVQGTYDVYSELDFGERLPRSAQAIVDVLSELGDDDSPRGNRTSDRWGRDPGAFVVDLFMRATCDWEHAVGDLKKVYTEDFRKWSGAQAEFFGGCGGWEYVFEAAQTVINRAFDAYAPDLPRVVVNAASDLAKSITHAKVRSTLEVQLEDEFGTVPFSHGLTHWSVTLSDRNGTQKEREFRLSDAGIHATHAEGAAILGSTGELELPEHTFEVQLGRLLRHVYREGVLPAYGVQSTGDLLRRVVDCPAVGRALASETLLIAEGEFRQACQFGTDLAGDLMEAAVELSLDTPTVFTLTGAIRGLNPDASQVAQHLRNGQWNGQWEERIEDSAPGEIGGTFAGARRGGSPPDEGLTQSGGDP